MTLIQIQFISIISRRNYLLNPEKLKDYKIVDGEMLLMQRIQGEKGLTQQQQQQQSRPRQGSSNGAEKYSL